MLTLCWCALWHLSALVAASCEPPIAFPAPSYKPGALDAALEPLSRRLDAYFGQGDRVDAAVALELASSQQQGLWSYFHLPCHAPPGAVVDGHTVFRGASHAKVFTALAILTLAANGSIASLDDPVAKYIDLEGPGNVEWTRISLRDILTHQAGVLDKFAQSDVVVDLDASTRLSIGLPPVENEDLALLPSCELNYSIPCDRAGLLAKLRGSNPVLPPRLQPSNSNAGYSLLGLVIEEITGKLAQRFIEETYIKPLNLTSTSFQAPPQGGAPLLPGRTLWDWDMGINNPSSGIYTTTSDLSAFNSWILRNADMIHPTIKWLSPAAFAAGSHSTIGMPWEIYRTNHLLPENGNRPVTLFSIEGWLGKFFSYSVLVPEYDISISALLGGHAGNLHALMHDITQAILRAVDETARQNLEQSYAGTYTARTGARGRESSTIRVAHTRERGLHIQHWTVNGTSVLENCTDLTGKLTGLGGSWYLQLVPTQISRRRVVEGSLIEEEGEVWRVYAILDAPAELGWNDYCVSSFDAFSFLGQPMNEVVLWRNEEGDDGIVKLEMASHRLQLSRQRSDVRDWLDSQRQEPL